MAEQPDDHPEGDRANENEYADHGSDPPCYGDPVVHAFITFF
jgi:hypothetical protein